MITQRIYGMFRVGDCGCLAAYSRSMKLHIGRTRTALEPSACVGVEALSMIYLPLHIRSYHHLSSLYSATPGIGLRNLVMIHLIPGQ